MVGAGSVPACGICENEMLLMELSTTGMSREVGFSMSPGNLPAASTKLGASKEPDEDHADERADAVGRLEDDDGRVARELPGVARAAADQVVIGPVWHDRDADAERERRGHDEAVAARLDGRAEDLEAGDRDVDEEEGGHAAEHA
eukprot:746020-Rhodomonas_salina.1